MKFYSVEIGNEDNITYVADSAEHLLHLINKDLLDTENNYIRTETQLNTQSSLNKANFVTEVTVVDPDSQGQVEVAIYKDENSGGMFGVDSSYLLTLSDDDPVIEPFNGHNVLLIEPDERA